MQPAKRRITIIEGQPPQFEGDWTVGEVRGAAQFLMQWVDNLQVARAGRTEYAGGGAAGLAAGADYAAGA